MLGIGLEVQYTKAMEDGSYKKVCLSADAQLEQGEDRGEAHRALYNELAEDLKAAFSNNGKKPSKTKSADYPEPPIPSQRDPEGKGTRTGKPQKNPETWCKIHKCEMPEHSKETKNGKSSRWYSHRLPDGTWCNGRAKKGGK